MLYFLLIIKIKEIVLELLTMKLVIIYLMGILGDLQNYFPFKDIKIKPTHKVGMSQVVQL